MRARWGRPCGFYGEKNCEDFHLTGRAEWAFMGENLGETFLGE